MIWPGTTDPYKRKKDNQISHNYCNNCHFSGQLEGCTIQGKWPSQTIHSKSA